MGLLLLAGALRVCGVGALSPWLDEVFQLERVAAPIGGLWRGSTTFPDHPPGSALLMRGLTALGAGEVGLRIASAVAAVAALVLLMIWAEARFGWRVAALVGLLGTVSPYHLRYSQELRPYPYLLLAAAATLVLADRVLSGRGGRWTISGFAAACAAGLWVHDTFFVVAAPVAAVAWARRRELAPRWRRRLAAGAGLALVLYVPLLPRLVRLAGTASAPTAQAWGWWFLSRRWAFLTVAGREGIPSGWGAAAFAFAVGLGMVVAGVRWRRGGLEVLAGLLAGIAGVESIFHFVFRRWTAGRYDMVGWPFLVILAALGLDALWRRARAAGAVAATALVAACLAGVVTYWTEGRPHWDRMAQAIRAVRRAGEPVLAESLFCERPLRRLLAGDGVEVIRLDGDLGRLWRVWPQDHSALLVRCGDPQSVSLRRVAARLPRIVAHPPYGWLYRLPPRSWAWRRPDGSIGVSGVSPAGAWPEPSLATLPVQVACPEGLCLGRWLAHPGWNPEEVPARLEFDGPETRRALVGSWGGDERTRDGTTFAWATSLEVGVAFQVGRARPLHLRLRLWPYAGTLPGQEVCGLVNGHALGWVPLAAGPHELGVPIPANALRPGTNLLVLQFARAVAPAELRPESRNRRPLAAALDWIEITARK